MDKAELLREAWLRGQLQFLLLPHQKPLYDAFRQAPSDEFFVALCARRFGKTTILILLAMEDCLRTPGTLVRFATTTQKELRSTIRPIVKKLLATCPEALRPKSKDFGYEFRNGSELHLAGTDAGHEDDLRGNASHLNVVDEAGKCSNLKYVVKSVMLPMTLTTDGKTILASTPALTMAHDFFNLYEEARLRGSTKMFTIHDNKALTEYMFRKAAKDSGGVNTDVYKREYLCEWVADAERKITPEFDPLQHVNHHVWSDMYHLWAKYTCMDIGWKDLCAVLFAHYDFAQAKLFIEDEHVVKRQTENMTNRQLAEAIIAREQTLWHGQQPLRRIADNNDPALLNDISQQCGLAFSPTGKDSLDAMVNMVRLWLRDGRIVINPNCKQLIGCLTSGIWNKQRTEFDHGGIYGHFDALASLMYLVRNVDVHTNPVPRMHGVAQQERFNYHVPRTRPSEDDRHQFENLLNIRRDR